MTFVSCCLQANKACKEDDAILATIEDATANNFIKAKLTANSWIGATDATKVGTCSSPTIKSHSSQAKMF